MGSIACKGMDFKKWRLKTRSLTEVYAYVQTLKDKWHKFNVSYNSSDSAAVRLILIISFLIKRNFTDRSKETIIPLYNSCLLYTSPSPRD